MKTKAILKMKCEKCKILEYCPKKGGSPISINNRQEVCHVIGGYGREPVKEHLLSKESKKLVSKYGDCLSIVEVPIQDEYTKKFYREVIKVFHPPIFHPREKNDYRMDLMYPKGCK